LMHGGCLLWSALVSSITLVSSSHWVVEVLSPRNNSVVRQDDEGGSSVLVAYRIVGTELMEDDLLVIQLNGVHIGESSEPEFRFEVEAPLGWNLLRLELRRGDDVLTDAVSSFRMAYQRWAPSDELERANNFRVLFKERRWGDGSSTPISGPGSTLQRTVGIRAALPSLFARWDDDPFRVERCRYNIRSLWDAGCGDMTWMASVNLTGIRCVVSLVGPDDGSYVGTDIVEDLVESHRDQFRDRTDVTFETEDLVVTAASRSVDLILCRDALMHLPHRDVMKV